MVLILFAHQDDEFGCFFLIEQLIKQGRDYNIIYLTSGALKGDTAEPRNRESIQVLRSLGVDEKKIFFMGQNLDIADGSLHRHLSTAYTGLIEFVNRREKVSSVLCPAWEGGHHDHDAVYLLALTIALRFRCLDKSRQFSLYHGKNLPYMFFKVLSPLKENGEVFKEKLSWSSKFRYIKYCTQYPSQLRTWIGLLPFVFMKYLFQGQQCTQKINLSCINEPPYDGSLLYERRNFCSNIEFNQYKDAYVQEVLSSYADAYNARDL